MWIIIGSGLYPWCQDRVPLCVVCCAKEGNLTTELELDGYLQEPLLALPGCRSVSSNATQRKHGKRHGSTTVHGHSPFLDYVVCRQPRVAEFSIVTCFSPRAGTGSDYEGTFPSSYPPAFPRLRRGGSISRVAIVDPNIQQQSL